MLEPSAPPPSLLLQLTSGIDLFATTVMLYPADQITKAADLTARAKQELAGTSLGMGFYGTSGWAIREALANGLIAGLINNAKAKGGVEMLREASVLQDCILDMSVLFPCTEIHSIDRPTPSSWSGMHLGGVPRMVYGRSPSVSTKEEQLYMSLPNETGIFEVDGNEV